MPEHFVTRLLERDRDTLEPTAPAGYDETKALTLDGDGRPYVVTAGPALVATTKTMDIDTRNIRDVAPW